MLTVRIVSVMATDLKWGKVCDDYQWLLRLVKVGGGLQARRLDRLSSSALQLQRFYVNKTSHENARDHGPQTEKLNHLESQSCSQALQCYE